MSKVLLSSGGMDSFLLAHEPELAGAVHVFVDIGQKYLDKELEAAAFVAESCKARLHVVRAAQIAKFEHSSGIIPFRNAEMILSAAQYGTEIYLGVIADEINSDKSIEFLAAMEMVLNISHRKQYWTEGKEYRILTPFRLTTKSQLVNRFLANGGSMGYLLRSVSCYAATDHHCGQCASCFKRWVALTNATQEDQGRYFGHHPALWKPLAHWKRAMEDYSDQRAAEISDALSRAKVRTK